MRKMLLVVLLAMSLLAGVFVTSCQGPADKSPAASQSSATKPQAINPAVAPMKSVTVDTGFVFIDGRYIESPYTLQIVGKQVLLNNIVVWQILEPKPRPSERVPTTDPGIPAWITEKTTFKELLASSSPEIVDDVMSQKWQYLIHNYPPKEAIDKMLAYVKELPCIAKVTKSTIGRDKYEFSVYFILKYDTIKDPIGLGFGPPGTYDREKGLDIPPQQHQNNVSPEEVSEYLKYYFERQMNCLKKNDVVFFEHGRLMPGIVERMAAFKLPKMLSILKSNETHDSKVLSIKNLGGYPSPSEIVDNYVPSQQLEDRVRELVKKIENLPQVF